MQVVQFKKHGGPEVLELVDRPLPSPVPGEVLVRMLAVSVNHLDLWVRRGMPGVPCEFPFIPGCDGSGEIVECGEGVTGLRPGDKVIVLPGISSGQSQHDQAGDDHLSADYHLRGEHVDGLGREFVALEERFVQKLPEGLDPVQAAALPLVFVTAWGALVGRAKLQAGESVLILGGSSGVGSAGIQVARDLGARVISTAGTEEKRAFAKSFGADEVLDHHDPDWPKKVKALTDGRGVDVVFEHIGPATWKGSMRSLARLGRLVTCGGTTGPEVSLLLPHLFMKNLSVLGSTMGPGGAYPEILAKVASGAYRPAVSRVMPLSEVQLAHRRLEMGDVLGKIVLVPGS
ncbi:MAG: NADPH:quinone reductase-like Zn-dependent oxidoreductase [Planctomycetota bacterium]|jgi:NADPH:quinone reductase-like Zn-dependent oxidoreductase